MNSPTPPPFGDPSRVRSENAAAIKKGIGCSCGGCAAIALGVVALAVFIVAIVMYSLRSANGTQEAVARAKQHPQIVAVLGEPIEVGWIISGSVKGTGVGSNVEVSIPLSGSKGSGTLIAHGFRETEQKWNFSVLSFAPKGSANGINLLNSQAEATPQ